jgi:hypothetical protein
MSSEFSQKIFFYCSPPAPPEKGAYSHSIVCLADGLKSLDVKFYSNIDFWQISPEKDEYLFNHDPTVTPNDCSIVILDCDWFVENSLFPDKLFHSGRNYVTVYFERSADAINLPKNAWQPEFRQFDFIFRTHYNQRFKYPANVYPWAFGLSHRILLETEDLPDFSEKKRNLLVNFRLSHPLRKTIQEEFLPLIQNILVIDNTIDNFDASLASPYHYLQWVQTGMRHYQNYYKRLKDSAACACFGGLLINAWPSDSFGPTKLWDRILNKTLNILDPRPKRLMNWDSFRFWESLAAGCLTFHLDLERYGALLPVMPDNWRHYIGINLDNMWETVDRVASDPDILARIAIEGRQWALEHYSPVPTALRFLKTVELKR